MKQRRANYGASGGNVGTLQTRSTNAANEITSVSGSWVTPTYDAAGNMVSAPKAGAETTRLWYVYDAWNRQVIVKNDSSGSPGSTLATYSYDGLNRRVTKDIAGGDTFDDYFNENWQRLESRKNGDTDPLDQFLWDLTYIDTPVLRWHDANTDGDLADLSSGDPDPTKDNTLYYTTDANHNVTALYDADQERVIERYVYDPYGKTFVYDRTWAAVSSSAVDNDVQWEGYVSDSETGNKLARNRYYGVSLATWYARDFAGYIDGCSLYQYVSDSPTRMTDPLGLAGLGPSTRPSKPSTTQSTTKPAKCCGVTSISTKLIGWTVESGGDPLAGWGRKWIAEFSFETTVVLKQDATHDPDACELVQWIKYGKAIDGNPGSNPGRGANQRCQDDFTTVTAIAPPPATVSDEYAKERREEFQMRVLSGKFNDLTADYGILALFICPEAPIPRLDLPKVKDAHAIDIMPLDGNGNRPLFAGRSILTNFRYRDDAPVHAVTEFTDQGIIMAVDADYLAARS